MRGFIYYEKEDAVRNRWFIDELISAGAAHNMEVHLLASDEELPSDADFLIYRGRDFEKSQRFEQQGIVIVNRSEVTRIANDKYQTFQLATMLGIPAIPTHVLTSSDQVRTYPVVLKTADGHGGTDVHLCNDAAEVDEIRTIYANIQLLVQPYIENDGSDIRLYVIGEEVVGAVRRRGTDSFKANVALGGTAQRFDAPTPLRDFAQRIAKGLKSDYVGVDFIQRNDGVWLLNEIEDPVGARALYETSELNVAHEVMQHIHKKITNAL